MGNVINGRKMPVTITNCSNNISVWSIECHEENTNIC